VARADVVASWFLSATERGNRATDMRAWTTGNSVEPLVDGATYFGRLYQELRSARRGDEIYLADFRGDTEELLAGAGTAAGASGGPGRGATPPPPFPTIPGVWSHDELNVQIKGKWHTMILDHGRIVKSTALQLTLREPDGTVAVIPLSLKTRIAPARFAETRPAFRRGFWAITMRIDDGAAVRVRLMLHA